MKIKEGEQLPNSEFYYLDSSGAAKKITTAEVFKNHKTIVIGVPGALQKFVPQNIFQGMLIITRKQRKKGLQKLFVFQLMIQM